MFANGAIPSVVDDDDKIYVDLAATIWHLMSSANAMEMSDPDDETNLLIVQTLNYVALAMLELLQFELEHREFGDPNEFMDLLDRLSQGLPPYPD
jgi:hypothetical protein